MFNKLKAKFDILANMLIAFCGKELQKKRREEDLSTKYEAASGNQRRLREVPTKKTCGT